MSVTITEPRDQWGTMDVGVLHAPGFYPHDSQKEAHASCGNMGDETSPVYYRVPVKRQLITVDGVDYTSAWRIYPTEEQLRLKPGWQKSVGEERR